MYIRCWCVRVCVRDSALQQFDLICKFVIHFDFMSIFGFFWSFLFDCNFFFLFFRKINYSLSNHLVVVISIFFLFFLLLLFFDFKITHFASRTHFAKMYNNNNNAQEYSRNDTLFLFHSFSSIKYSKRLNWCAKFTTIRKSIMWKAKGNFRQLLFVQSYRLRTHRNTLLGRRTFLTSCSSGEKYDERSCTYLLLLFLCDRFGTDSTTHTQSHYTQPDQSIRIFCLMAELIVVFFIEFNHCLSPVYRILYIWQPMNRSHIDYIHIEWAHTNIVSSRL